MLNCYIDFATIRDFGCFSYLSATFGLLFESTSSLTFTPKSRRFLPFRFLETCPASLVISSVSFVSVAYIRVEDPPTSASLGELSFADS